MARTTGRGVTATRDTLHMWMQVVGKVRLAKAPMVNHWWQVPLYEAAAEHAGWDRHALEADPARRARPR